MRASGILMPVFSLPSKYGIGTFGEEAFRFVDFLRKAGQTYWQILPIGPTGFGDSPYQSVSSFAGNPYFIDPALLAEDGLLTEKELTAVTWSVTTDAVAYPLLRKYRPPLLSAAVSRFRDTEAFAVFCAENAWWLDDFALFSALKEQHGGAPWYEWEAPLRDRDTAALTAAAVALSGAVRQRKIEQYWVFSQWRALKAYANRNGVSIIGDLPIYVSYDSADVWASPEQFALDAAGKPTEVAGCPPDAFSATGQLWGNPVYRWDVMKRDGYAWWCRRMAYYRELFDVTRLDHFRGFESYYCIPAGDTDATKGIWRKGPGKELFAAFKQKIGQLSLIAEDLGYLTPAVRQLVHDVGFPGMIVLEFAFDPSGDSVYLPHHHTKNSVVYTGTHDNDTINGWLSHADAASAAFARRYLRLTKEEGENWGVMKAALQSPADTCILQMQDFMGLGSAARINTPSTVGDNWKWRIEGGCINDWLANIIHECTALYRRLPVMENENQETT